MALQPDTVHCVTASSYHPFDDGSGIKAGIWAGGAKENDATPMIFDRGSVLPGQNAGYILCDDGVLRYPGQNYQLNIGSQPFLKVNRKGERFANESTPYDNMLFAAGRQPGGVFCQVFDGNCDADIIRFKTIGCASYTRAMVEYAGFTAEEFIDFDGGSETFFKADTLDELADMLGFEGADKETFLATCEHYNELFDAQKDTDYGKEAYRLSELRTPPFYGCWFGGSLLTTLDGLRVNAKLQVLDADYNVVPGLYAVGDASGSFFNTNYPEYFPGVAAGRSVTEGRQCVKMIAKDAAFPASAQSFEIAEPEAAPTEWNDGTYTGNAQGIGGMISVTLNIKDGKITVAEIGPNYETPRYPGYFAISSGLFAEQIEAAQGPDIDGITAATLTTGAVKMAVRNALIEAGK
ncbi:MAG: FAD-binding protein [Coriobacteriales bacterium]|nr:FAD-binding protein [Coriobacteriales bacterium]